ncbi:hypothetical protein Bca4012_076120 [Brassica carinata]
MLHLILIFTIFTSSLLITFYIFLETYLDGFGVSHLRRRHLRRFSSPLSSSSASLIAGVANLRCHHLRLSPSAPIVAPLKIMMSLSSTISLTFAVAVKSRRKAKLLFAELNEVH